MDELVQTRIVSVGIVAALCCLGLGVRVVFQKTSIGPDDAALQLRDTDEISSDHGSFAKRLLMILDFRSLSASSQRTLGLILLIPAGTLITAVYRRLTGMRMIGTFSPTLLALSQTKSDWRIGLPVFFAIFGVGIFFRMIFTRLKLPAVSRRGVAAVFVVFFWRSPFRFARSSTWILIHVPFCCQSW